MPVWRCNSYKAHSQGTDIPVDSMHQNAETIIENLYELYLPRIPASTKEDQPCTIATDLKVICILCCSRLFVYSHLTMTPQQMAHPMLLFPVGNTSYDLLHYHSNALVPTWRPTLKIAPLNGHRLCGTSFKGAIPSIWSPFRQRECHSICQRLLDSLGGMWTWQTDEGLSLLKSCMLVVSVLYQPCYVCVYIYSELPLIRPPLSKDVLIRGVASFHGSVRNNISKPQYRNELISGRSRLEGVHCSSGMAKSNAIRLWKLHV